MVSLLESEKSEFVAVYGRRRVGKTYLVREAFNYNFAFQHAGIQDATMKEQLEEFHHSLLLAGVKGGKKPRNWSQAFFLLGQHLAALPEGKKVVFIDELPWLDTPCSKFVTALDHFWNGWASARKDIVLVVCGSATSWIIDNIVMNYGGLHNRLTRQIYIEPFTLMPIDILSYRVNSKKKLSKQSQLSFLLFTLLGMHINRQQGAMFCRCHQFKVYV